LGSADGSASAWFDARRPARHPQTIVLTVTGRLDRSDAARFAVLVEDQLRGRPASVVICDVGGLVAPDAAAVDAICRIRLGVRRAGGRLRLRHAAPELRDLIDLIGLCDVLSTRPRSGFETRR
jgi:anti-anti-sigma factor